MQPSEISATIPALEIVSGVDMPEVPEHWQEWPEWIPRNWCKEVFSVDTIAGVAYVINQLAERGITIEQENYNTPEQPRWFLKRDDVFEAYIYRETHMKD